MERITQTSGSLSGNTYLVVNYELYQIGLNSRETLKETPTETDTPPEPQQVTAELETEKETQKVTSISKEVKEVTPYETEFTEAWEQYPQRDGSNPRKPAYKAYLSRVRSGIDPADLLKATKGYHAFCDEQGNIGTRFVLAGATFYGPNERWQEYLEFKSAAVARKEREKPMPPELTPEELAASRAEIRKLREAMDG
jgi:hypothetical protein